MTYNRPQTTDSGFSIIELLVTLAIAAVVVTIVTLSFSRLNDNQALDKTTLSIVSILNEARNASLTSLNSGRYGVRIEEGRVVTLPTYATTTLNTLVGVRNLNLNGGGNTIYFEKLTGQTSQHGSFEVYLRQSTTTYRIVNINSNGVVQ